MIYRKKILWIILLFLLLPSVVTLAQTPIRVGTTAAAFLDIGYGPSGQAMGDAYVSVVNDLSGIYWNPAGLAFMEQNAILFSYQPWVADINTYFVAAGVVIPHIVTLGVGLIGVNYGEMDVTSVEMQEGTGEKFYASDYAVNLSIGRRLATWFAFGATAKYIRSSIWHTNANAIAIDLGVLIETPFFTVTGSESNGLKIGMSLSNYGTKMRYSGIDLLRSVDIAPDESGNYKDSQALLVTDEWDIPLIFRVGVSVQPVVSLHHQLTLAVDALHTNNYSETINIGAEYAVTLIGMGKCFFRGGYRAAFMNQTEMEKSEFGPTFGVGVAKNFVGNTSIQFDYTYRDIGILGYINSFGLCATF